MLSCKNCLRWWQKLFIDNDGKEKETGLGTCLLDGIRTNWDFKCGFHSDLQPIKEGEPLRPDKERLTS